MKRSFVILFAAAAAAAWSCTREPVISEDPVEEVPQITVPDDDTIVKGWVRIKLAEDAAPLRVGAFTRGEVDSGDPRLDEIAQQLGATEIKRVFAEGGRFAERRRRYGLHLWYDIKIGEDVPVSRAQAELVSIPGVAHVQPIYTIKLADHNVVPAIMADCTYNPAAVAASRPTEMPFDDPELSKQWHYNSNGSLPKAAIGADINLFKGWEITTGSRDVIVAVVDMGIQYDHPDLEANMWVNEEEMAGTPGNDDDDNGYVDDFYGWNFAKDYESGEIVPGYHGTHIAGTISAVNNNATGVCGIAGGSGHRDGVKLMSIQWSAGNQITVPNYDMFVYAADNGAVIASCSWDTQSPEIAPDLMAGLEYFFDNAGMDDLDRDGKNDVQSGPMKGGLVMFAAGNSGANKLRYPAADERVVCVASMAPDFNKADYSNYTPEVDILAPGGSKSIFGEQYGVYSTMPEGQYGYLEGTSMATPHVSGVAALIVSKFGGQGFTRDDLKKKLLASFRPISPVVPAAYANQIGVGLVDASLIEVEDPRTAPANLEVYGAEGLPDSLRIYCKVPADGNDMPVMKYVLEYAPVNNGTTGEWTTMDLVNTAEVGEEYSYGFELVQKTTYALKMTPVDRFGHKGEQVTFEATTLEHTNHAPRQKAKFLDLQAEKPGEKYAKKFQLAYYFVDEDIPYGDALTFSAASSDEAVAQTIMPSEERLTVLPMKKGVATITVRATDKAGLYAEASFTLTVKEDGYVNVKPEVSTELGSVRMEGTGEEYKRSYNLSRYFDDPNIEDGDELTYALSNSNPDILQAGIEGTELVLLPLAEGTAQVTVTATDLAGETAQSVLTVTIGKGGISAGGNIILSNPAGETLSLGLAAAAGMKAQAVIYDSAARRVMTASVDFDGAGNGSLNVKSLAPGSYQLAIDCKAGNYKAAFLKR